jgi:transposase
MAKRKVYTEEFKQQAVRLVVVERQAATRVARDLGVSESALYGWVAEYRERLTPELEGKETPEQELKRLRKENKILQMERDILKKAAAFFAKENS